MLQAEYENEAMNDDEVMIKNEAIEIASDNCSALESAPSASLMDVASPNRTKQPSFADLYTGISSSDSRSTTPEAAAGSSGGLQ
ncbi:hypothetical protein BV898_18784 [Hypsibius exemplaris]|uniref:Uncharacterized protein n=1 Tax=Hypsibius exemplaris TaxID=2072580 RepID=A0A9X6RNT6_HYPEX|nr:hypothetical protein BV898_18784 [Hypsibius exemplaris]